MDWKSVASVYGVLLITGVVVSLLSTQLQCSKISFLVSFIQGLQFAAISTIPYALTYFDQFRTLLVDPLSEKLGPSAAIGFVIMLAAWPAGVLNVGHSESQTCVASTSEMTDFKNKLMKELADKQAAEEKNANAKPSQ
jgi:hypothetical protein